MPWIVDPERAGGGALLDEGVHEVDLLRHYFGTDAWEERGEPFPFKTLHERMAQHFVDVLVDGVEANASLRDGHRAMLMARGAYEAADSGRRYEFDWGTLGS